MNDTVKKYLIQETELCILLALKGVRTLYGIGLDSAEAMTRESLYYNLFTMQKKGIIARRADSGEIRIEEGLDCCIERIRTAGRFIVLADADELVPEKYFYVADSGAVMLESVGQYNTRQHAGAFHMEAVTADDMRDRIQESGFANGTAKKSVPAEVLGKAQSCWREDKDEILRHSTVEKLLQEYNVRTQCKLRQCVRFGCGLDAYLVCGDGNGVIGDSGIEGGEKS